MKIQAALLLVALCSWSASARVLASKSPAGALDLLLAHCREERVFASPAFTGLSFAYNVWLYRRVEPGALP